MPDYVKEVEAFGLRFHILQQEHDPKAHIVVPEGVEDTHAIIQGLRAEFRKIYVNEPMEGQYQRTITFNSQQCLEVRMDDKRAILGNGNLTEVLANGLEKITNSFSTLEALREAGRQAIRAEEEATEVRRQAYMETRMPRLLTETRGQRNTVVATLITMGIQLNEDQIEKLHKALAEEHMRSGRGGGGW